MGSSVKFAPTIARAPLLCLALASIAAAVLARHRRPRRTRRSGGPWSRRSLVVGAAEAARQARSRAPRLAGSVARAAPSPGQVAPFAGLLAIASVDDLGVLEWRSSEQRPLELSE